MYIFETSAAIPSLPKPKKDKVFVREISDNRKMPYVTPRYRFEVREKTLFGSRLIVCFHDKVRAISVASNINNGEQVVDSYLFSGPTYNGRYYADAVSSESNGYHSVEKLSNLYNHVTKLLEKSKKKE